MFVLAAEGLLDKALLCCSSKNTTFATNHHHFNFSLFFFSLCLCVSVCVHVRVCFSRGLALLRSAVTGLMSPLYAHLSCAPLAVGPLELANALAACCLSSRLSSQHRQWAAQQLVRTLAAHDRDNQSRPQTFADVAGDLRKWSTFRLEAHQSRV